MANLLRCILLLIQLTFAIAALPPDHDEFYQPPDGFEDAEPGTILRTRTIPSSLLLGLLPAGVQSYQLLFRTTVIGGRPDVGVTTVFRPPEAMRDRFLSFHTHYDFSSTNCNPSYSYQLGSLPRDLISEEENQYIAAFLLSGYIVSSPDYEGPDAAFGVGRLSGQVTLDSMKAVVSFRQTLGMTTNHPAIVGYGYSGGSIASGWGAQLQANYAPDLNIRGWVVGGVVADIKGTALRIDNTLFSGFIPAVVDGFRKPSAYASEVVPVIRRIITPYGQAALDFASRNCISALLAFIEQSIFSTRVQKLGRRLLQEPTIARVLAEQTMGTTEEETPIAPVYIYHGGQDEIAPYEDARTLLQNWCDNGASVTFLTLATAGHLLTEPLGFPGAYQFVQQAFAGEIPREGCRRSSVPTDKLNPLALGVNLEPVLIKLIDGLADLARAESGDVRVLQDPTETLNGARSATRGEN